MKAIDKLIQICSSSTNENPKLTEISELLKQEKFFDLLTDFDGRNPLHFLATRDNIEAIKYLLLGLPNLNINQKDDMGFTALSNACYMGTLPMILELMARGANPFITAFGGKTLLHLVAGNPRMSAEDKELAIYALINIKPKGLNPRIRDAHGQTYQDILKFNQAKDLQTAGIDPFGRSILHWAAYSFEAYKTQYSTREDLINNVDDVGRTPLMYAVSTPISKPGVLPLEFNMPYIEWLIKHGCSVTAQDKGGKTALHFAARWGNEAVINYLLENKADPLLSDHMDQTPLDIAERYAPEALTFLQPESQISYAA